MHGCKVHYIEDDDKRTKFYTAWANNFLPFPNGVRLCSDTYTNVAEVTMQENFS